MKLRQRFPTALMPAITITNLGFTTCAFTSMEMVNVRHKLIERTDCMFDKLLGINWKTTLAGITSLMAIAGAMFAAWKAKDFQAIFDNMPLFFTALGVVITALGLMKAKDQNVTGTGATAKTLDASTGTLTNREGDVVGHQPVKP